MKSGTTATGRANEPQPRRSRKTSENEEIDFTTCIILKFKNETLNPPRNRTGENSERVVYLRIAAAFLSATAAALWHSWSDPKKGGMCGNSGINTIKQAFNGCFSIFANLNDFIT